MSRNPHHRLPYGRPQQQNHRQRQQRARNLHPQQQHHQHQHHQQDTQPPMPSTSHYPATSTLPAPNVHHTFSSLSHHHLPGLHRPDPPATSLQQVSSGQDIGFEVLPHHHPQNPPLYSDTPDQIHSNVSHAAFPGSTTHHPPLTEVYTQPAQSRSQYPIWPPDPLPQPPQPPAMPSQRAQPSYHPQQQPQQQLPKYEPNPIRTAPVKRERPIDPAASHPIRTITAVTAPTQPAPGSSTDTRRGKERVQRPCAHCGLMNHIRKNKCSRCDAPKEPAKKRTKRQRKRKTQLPAHSPVGAQAPNPVLLSQRQGLEPDLHHISINRAESLVERQDARDAVQPLFDTRSLTFPTSSQQHGSTTVETQPTHPSQHGQRQSQDFPGDAPFEESQGNYPHP